MANRIQRTVLSCLLVATGIPAMPTWVHAQATDPILSPQVERRRVSEAQIDRSDIEVGGYVGVLSIEDFGSSAVLGARAAWHVSEDVFLEASIGQGEAGKTSFETFNPGVELLDDDERVFRYYNLAVGYNLLPGEAFIGRQRAFNTSFYLLGGAGSTRFAGDDNFTVSLAAGYRVLLGGGFALRIEMRDHVFSAEVTGANKTTQNLEWTLGLGGYF